MPLFLFILSLKKINLTKVDIVDGIIRGAEVDVQINIDGGTVAGGGGRRGGRSWHLHDL